MNALHAIQEFVSLQTSLLALLGAERGSVPLSLHMGTLPRTGDVKLGTEVWAYVRHGSGVSFKGPSGIVVDAHRLVDEPESFDAWRLRTYFGSLRGRGVKLVADATGNPGVSLDTGVETLLACMVERGEVLSESGYFRLPQGLRGTRRS
jgi:hypothetical protein